MKTVCAFPGCKSGSAHDKKINKLFDLPNKAMFKFPRKDKFPAIRQKWENFIGRQATDTDVLCEKHFAVEDVQKQYEILLSNGTKHSMDRGKIRLKPRAIPQDNTYNKENGERELFQSSPSSSSAIKKLQREANKLIICEQQAAIDANLTLTQNVQPKPIPLKMKDMNVFSHENSNTLAVQNIQQKSVSLKASGMNMYSPEHTRNISEDLNENCENNQTSVENAVNCYMNQASMKSSSVNCENHQTSPVSAVNCHKNQTSVESPVDCENNQTSLENPITCHKNQTSVKSAIDCKSNQTSVDDPVLTTPAKETRIFRGPESKKSMPASLKLLYRELKEVELPPGWSSIKLPQGEGSLLVGHFSGNRPAKKEFVIYADGSVEVFIQGKCVYVPGIRTGTNVDSVLHNISILTKLLLCEGTTVAQRHSQLCKGFREPDQKHFKYGHVQCISCKNLNAQLARKERAKMARWKKQSAKLQYRRHKLKDAKRSNKKLKEGIRKCRIEVAEWKQRCRQTSDAQLKQAISTLPKEQQEAVTMCFNAAKVTCKGRRYNKEWVYECMLMRVKSRKLYEHIRSRNILPLPDTETLSKWLRGMGSIYGFNETIFSMLSEKAREMEPADRRGILLVDEMKLSEAIKLNRHTMQFDGFVFLGKNTPEHLRDKIGDHALVIMFQPLRGQWVQVIATFLSKGCADSNVLHSIILECIILLEKSGFFVDGVTTDGATWNRSMWKKWGIDEKNIYCSHPCDSERKLWFFSDFPHLIKTFRNSIISEYEFWTPDGVIKKKHWEALLQCENQPYALKIAHKLTPDHLNPKYHQKMNVPLAFQLFDERVAVAMEIYRDFHADLADCQPTINFIRRVHKLIEVMMSRTPQSALRPNSETETVIIEFLEYLHEWNVTATTNGFKFLTESTSYGLNITLRATLQILEFLTFECNYLYVMTARLNQDALERFFGLARSVCGANDHPNAILFGQMFRLMSTYSLIKPVKGSNVSGGENLKSLLTFSDVAANRSGRLEWHKIMDSIVESGYAERETSCTDGKQDKLKENEKEGEEKKDGSQSLMEYMAGYIVRNPDKWTKCNDCITSMLAEPNYTDYKMIKILNKGYLKNPSMNLVKLVQMVEKTVLTVVEAHSINADTVFHISYALREQESEMPLIGCPLHEKDLTTALLSFYVLIRAEFLAKQHTSQHCLLQKQKSRRSRKDAKI